MDNETIPIIITTGQHIGDARSAIDVLCRRLEQHGWVDDHYAEAVWKREQQFSTGLPTRPPVALPHADPEHVLQNAIAVGVFAHPLSFVEMGGEEQLEVKIVFLLALREKDAAVPVLSWLAQCFRNERQLSELEAAPTVTAARSTLQQLLANHSAEAPFSYKLYTEKTR